VLAPTPTPGNSSTAVATTAFVSNAITSANLAPLSSPTFTGVPLAPTQAVGNNSTAIATTAFVLANSVGKSTVNGVANVVSDGIGNLRSIPQNTQASTYTLVASDNGKNINGVGAITIPSGVFAAGDVVSIYNQSGTAFNISWSGPVVYKAGTSTAATSPLSLSARGIATIMFATTTEIVASGNFA
jgi:hypothetical protein